MTRNSKIVTTLKTNAKTVGALAATGVCIYMLGKAHGQVDGLKIVITAIPTAD